MPGGKHSDIGKIQIFELVVPQGSLIFTFGLLEHEQSANFVHDWELPDVELDDFCLELDILDNELDPSIGHELANDEPHFFVKFLPTDPQNLEDIGGDGLGIVEEVGQNRIAVLILIFSHILRNINIAEKSMIEVNRIDQRKQFHINFYQECFELSQAVFYHIQSYLPGSMDLNHNFLLVLSIDG